MAAVFQNIGHIVLMLVLLSGSAFFSGAETAFFSLSRRQVSAFKKSNHKLQNLVASLLSNPTQLLSCLLFGNMVVNILFFAACSVLVFKIDRQIGITAAALTATAGLMVLVLLGEIVPKSLSYANSKSVSTSAAVPVFLCLQVLKPVVFVFRFVVVEPVLRLLLGRPAESKPVTTNEFKSLVEQISKRGLITADQNRLVAEIIELGFLKVRHCLRPRVDMVACSIADSAETARGIMRENNMTKSAVYKGSIDNIVGMVYLRGLLLYPHKPLSELIEQVHFVPEQKTIESLLEFFHKVHTDTAIVVDEYGGIAGSICLEDIVEELLGPIEIAGAGEPIEKIGPLEYRLAGNLAIHDWADTFNIDPAATRVSTIAGLVLSLLGKIPKTGDVARLRNLKFTVERVQKHRIETVVLTFESITTNDS